MSPRISKIKKSEWHKQSVDVRLAIGFLTTFAFLIGIYLIANFRAASSPITIFDNPNFGAAVSDDKPAGADNKPRLKAFSSPDDFKSYLDDGNRAFIGGIYEERAFASANNSASVPPAIAKTAAAKTPAKNQKIDNEVIAAADGLRYMSLGKIAADSTSDIILSGEKNIYFSPENQYYRPAFMEAAELPAGETKIFDIGDPAAMAQIGMVAQDGDLLMADNALVVISENSVSAFDVSSAFVPVDLWKARVNEGTKVVAQKTIGSKLYLGLRTKIDAANPCPVKPLSVGDKPLIIDCAAIFHPEPPIMADSIFTVVEIDVASGQTSRDISFVGGENTSAVFLSDGSAAAVWGQGGDYISFFTDFLQDKCKGLLPNYLLEKASKLPGCAISLAAKELELRSLLSNWFGSLNGDEQTRIAGEVSGRLSDYLRDHYRDFEQTGIALADMGSFSFSYQNQVAGRLVSGGLAAARDGSLRLATVSGSGAVKKMNWLVTGKIDTDGVEKILNNIYVLGANLEISAAGENLDLAAGVCALRYSANAAYLSTCRGNDPVYAVGFAAGAAGVASRLKTFGFPAYLYPFDDGFLLEVSKNSRKIKLTLYDATMASKIDRISEFDVNDYWADFDGNYAAFASDEAGKTFFLPAARGGYVFSRAGGKIELKKNIGSLAVGRAFFRAGYLYLAGDDGIEVFLAPDWNNAKTIRF